MATETPPQAESRYAQGLARVRENKRVAGRGLLQGPIGIELDDGPVAPQPAVVQTDAAESAVLARQAEQDRQFRALQRDARASHRAFAGWNGVDADGWVAACEQAAGDYANGTFLLRQLGAEIHLAPELTAVLWRLHQQLIEQYGAHTVAEQMLIDAAILAYYNLLRVQGWIGDAATILEREWFGQDPTPRLKNGYGPVLGLQVEEVVQRLTEQLIALWDRCNRALVRNLKALKELRAPILPNVAIGQAGQVNVGGQQVNSIVPPQTQASERGDDPRA